MIVAWVGALCVLNAALNGVGGAETNADFSLPDVESKHGIDILEQSFGGQGAGFQGSIAFEAGQGVHAPEVERQMQALFDDMSTVDGIVGVTSPYGESGERQVAASGTIAYARVDIDPEIDEGGLIHTAADARDLVAEADETSKECTSSSVAKRSQSSRHRTQNCWVWRSPSSS